MYNGQKHPHGRGEDGRSFSGRIFSAETPPRTWGRLLAAGSGSKRKRNTPTDVGKTFTGRVVVDRRWKHPHGRGEDDRLITALTKTPETPPRTWGRLEREALLRPIARNTPTDVGKTLVDEPEAFRGWKHPHGRGEDPPSVPLPSPPVETPPRTWGRQAQWRSFPYRRGNTPTDVGKTRTVPA